MKKVFALALLALGTFMFIRWDDIKYPIMTLKNNILISLGFVEEDPPVGFYILTERIAVKTNGGVRAVPAGTEVRLISQENSIAHVDDGASSFDVLISKLSRDIKLRSGPRYQSKGITHINGDSEKKAAADFSESGSQKNKLEAKIKDLDGKLLELAESLRDLSKLDPQKGRVGKSEEAIRELQKQIVTLESERDHLKAEMHKL